MVDKIIKMCEFPKELEVGDEYIDAQHREMFDIFCKLLLSFYSKDSIDVKKSMREFIFFLMFHAKNHFRDEERYMREVAYPKYEEHKALHLEYISHVEQIKERLDKEDITAELVELATDFVLGWIVSHIKTHDVELAQYIRGRTGGQPSAPDIQKTRVLQTPLF